MPRPIRIIRKIRKVRALPIPPKRGQSGNIGVVHEMIRDQANSVLVDHNGNAIISTRKT